MTENPISTGDRFPAEVRERFGVLPNFFCTAPAAAGLIEKLWGFAKSGYLDCPLPSLFKERLFVHLSRFCETRYCIVRHVGFLMGEGRPAGDASALPHTVGQILGLLRKPLPNAERLEQALLLLEGQSLAALPAPETEVEGALFDALTIVFVAPRRAERARKAVTAAVGEMTFEIVTAFLAFVRTAHYWTETHPTLAYEADMVAVMKRHPDLAQLMLDTSDAEWAQAGDVLRRALADLQSTAGTLRATEERFRAFVIATSNVLYRMSPDWTEMWQLDGQGFISDTVRPSRDWLSEYIHSDDHARATAAIAAAVTTKSVFELEHRVKRVDGTWAWALSRAVPILDGQGEIIEWFGAARDVTVRRHVEDALREGDRRKDEFLATLAHELRNPLAPIRQAAKIADSDRASDSQRRWGYSVIERQVQHMSLLLDDLFDVSRITRGALSLRKRSVDLRDAVSGAVEVARPLIDSRHHELIVEASDALLLNADPLRLSQILANLLTNAAKYTQPGGTIRLIAERQARTAMIRVEDTGIGLSEEDMPRIFEMFSQATSHETSQGGLGIGLALTKGLVEMHGGTIEARSAGRGEGSVFIVRLPLDEMAHFASPHNGDEREPLPVVSRQRVLIADDNRDAAESLAILLRFEGHDVVVANDGDVALRLFEAHAPDVVLLDIGMPQLNGYEVARRIRASANGAHVLLVAVTGWGQEKDRRKTREAGFDHHLTKPVEPDAVIRLLQQGTGAVISVVS